MSPRPLAPAMPEAELQGAVVKLCKLLGLQWHHQHYSIGSRKGWPDLVICGRGILFRELKREGNGPTAAQLAWGEILRRAGQDWDVWKPSDLQNGRIQRELEAIR